MVYYYYVDVFCAIETPHLIYQVSKCYQRSQDTISQDYYHLHTRVRHTLTRLRKNEKKVLKYFLPKLKGNLSLLKLVSKMFSD